MPLLLLPYSSAAATKGFRSFFAFWMGGAGIVPSTATLLDFERAVMRGTRTGVMRGMA